MPSTALALKSLPRPDWLPSEVWPLDTGGLEIDGSLVAVSEIGRGPVLLFYTGIGSFIWRDVMVQLSTDFRCITLDPPGIGLSARIPHTQATLQRSAGAVEATIEALDLQDVTLIVHDSGGPPAFAAAARLPSRISGLVAINTFGWRPIEPAFRGVLTLMGSGVTRQFSVMTGALARLTVTSFGVGRHLDEASRRAYRVGIQKSMDAFHDYLRDARDSDLYPELAKGFAGPLSQLPLLTIFGERNDPLKFQPRWKARFPNARQLVIPRGNHFPMCDDPDFVVREISQWYRESVHRHQGRRS
jgi:pimeloyl-ACP methyl ester carboxylesterase